MAEVFQSAIIGKGTTFAISLSTVTIAYVVLADVFDISLPKLKTDDKESTTYASEDKEFIPGLTDNGAISLKLNYVAASMSALYAAVKQVVAFQITLPDTSAYTFEGFITGISGTVPIDNRVESEAEIKISGTVTYTPPTGGVAVTF